MEINTHDSALATAPVLKNGVVAYLSYIAQITTKKGLKACMCLIFPLSDESSVSWDAVLAMINTWDPKAYFDHSGNLHYEVSGGANGSLIAPSHLVTKHKFRIQKALGGKLK